MELAITVQIEGKDVPAGTLYTNVRNGVETASFSYEPGFLQNPRAFALEPALPLVPGTTHAHGLPLFRIFEDCMPDRWGRNLMLRNERSTAKKEARTARTLFEADLLAGVSDRTRQGAIRVWKNGVALAPSSSGIPRETSIPSLLSSADLAAKDMDADVRDLFEAGSSLGGARPKASVIDERGRLHIAKFPKVDESPDEDVGAWENVALQLASKAGISTPNTRLLRIKKRPVLLVERFDRKDEERIPYLSGITAVQGRDGERYSCLELIEFLEECGSAPEKDIKELWKRGLFSCAIGNTDNHMRNHGFLRDRNGWKLSPAFDVNPTPGDNPKSLSSSLDFGRYDAEPEVALSVCDYYRFTLLEAREEAARMAQVLESWRIEARRNGISPSSIEAMSTCFESGIDKLRKAARS